MKKPLFGICLLLTCLALPAQPPSITFGKVPAAELEMKTCDFYPDAQALVSEGWEPFSLSTKTGGPICWM